MNPSPDCEPGLKYAKKIIAQVRKQSSFAPRNFHDALDAVSDDITEALSAIKRPEQAKDAE